MFAAVGTLGLSFLAGLLSTLSPCVLPLLPIVMGSAVASHRRGPLALALGSGSAMEQPLAVAIISGLLVQVPLVLLVMPALYSLLIAQRRSRER